MMEEDSTMMMDVDVPLQSQRTAEIACPSIYAQLEFCLVRASPSGSESQQQQQPAVSSAEGFAGVVRTAARRLFGTAGAAALGCEVLGLCEGRREDASSGVVSSRAVVRVPKGNFGKLMAACAALSTYDDEGTPCTLTVTCASPFLMALECSAGGPSNAAAECLMQLERACGSVG